MTPAPQFHPGQTFRKNCVTRVVHQVAGPDWYNGVFWSTDGKPPYARTCLREFRKWAKDAEVIHAAR